MTSTTETQQVQASVLHGIKDLRLETRSLPAPSADEVQIAIHSTGLCGSDLHYYSHYRNGDIIVREPLTLGHESAGIVVSAPPSSSLSVGDHVALEVGVPCSACTNCTSGRYNICPTLRFRSSAKSFPHFQGTLQSRINHPAKWCHKLPASVSLAEGALLEPLSVALHAVRRSLMPQGARVLVLGAGAVGALCAGVAKMKGAGTVVIADIDEGRTEFAVNRRFADARFTVPLKRGKDVDEGLQIAKDTAQEIGEVKLSDGTALGPVDVVFECTGVQACVQAGIYATTPGGRVMLVGMGNPIQTLALSAAALREVDLVGVFRYANTYAEGIELVARQRPEDPDFKALVTHTVQGLENVEKAFEMAGKTKDAEGKLVLKVVLETPEGAR
ncbi:sorbitol dehydrogenase-like protein [Myriangium duriaei CBS 260.36]|uniref:Sorbitol dehydrogenase-like protein n=1 Tax=Myriangium duriaei CBS 260.36 TaxID=1168546 RepID=A0A9P4IXJ4_9PEZI|nr:sorbitol dehydrogenase-like protein [Myriangium duriaei CBS 260.36]